MKKYKVTLTEEERDQLNEIISKGSHSAQLYRTAYILLNCDEGKYGNKLNNEQVSKVLQISMRNDRSCKAEICGRRIRSMFGTQTGEAA